MIPCHGEFQGKPYQQYENAAGYHSEDYRYTLSHHIVLPMEYSIGFFEHAGHVLVLFLSKNKTITSLSCTSCHVGNHLSMQNWQILSSMKLSWNPANEWESKLSATIYKIVPFTFVTHIHHASQEVPDPEILDRGLQSIHDIWLLYLTKKGLLYSVQGIFPSTELTKIVFHCQLFFSTFM